MLRFKMIIFLSIIVCLLLAACQPAATPVPEEDFNSTEPPAATEAPAATEVPFDTESPAATAASVAEPSPTPESAFVPTVAPGNESERPSANCPIFQITSPEWIDQLRRSPLPVLMYFWADWDAASIAFTPTVQEIANEYAGRVKVGQVKMDDFPEIGYSYGVQELPAFLFMDGDNELARVDGATSKDEITEMMDQQFANYPILAENESTVCLIDAVVNITGYNMEEIAQSPLPVLLFIWSPQEGPSVYMEPKVQVLASEYAGRIQVESVNMDDAPEVGYTYTSGELPAFIFLNQGTELARLEGTTSKDEVVQMIDEQLANIP